MTIAEIFETVKFGPGDNRTPATESAIREFESRNGLCLLSEHKDFLTTVLNGGYPLDVLAIPTSNCHGGAAGLHGLYGIDCPDTHYDMQSAIDDLSNFPLQGLVPFGFDQLNGHVFVEANGSFARLVYIPWDELVDSVPLPRYYVASSIADFFEAALKLTARLKAEKAIEMGILGG